MKIFVLFFFAFLSLLDAIEPLTQGEKSTLASKAYTLYHNDPKFKKEAELVLKNFALQYWEEQKSNLIVLSSNEIEKFYKDHFLEFKKDPEMRIRDILIKSKAANEDILKQLSSAPKNELLSTFEYFAKAYSQDKGSASDGGKIGWQSIPKFASVFKIDLSKVEKGAILSIQANDGYHIVLVEEVDTNTQISLEEAKTRIENTLKREKLLQFFHQQAK